MKKVISLIVAALCVVATFAFTSCSMKGRIETIACDGQTFGTLYRHKVKEIQLVVKTTYSNEDWKTTESEVIETTKEFKYYYSTEDYLYISEASATKSHVEYYFPEKDYQFLIDRLSGYQTLIIRIIFDGISKEFRPSYTLKGDMATVSYYEYQSGSSSSYFACKKESNYAEYDKLKKEFAKKQYEFRNDEEKLNSYMEEIEEKYKATFFIFEEKISFNTKGVSFEVEYHK